MKFTSMMRMDQARAEIGSLFRKKAETLPDTWDIKISHECVGVNYDHFERALNSVDTMLRELNDLEYTWKFDVVAARFEVVDGKVFAHEYLRLSDDHIRQKKDHWEFYLELENDLTREETIAYDISSRYFLSTCIRANVDTVEDRAGNILDVKSIAVPFKPAPPKNNNLEATTGPDTGAPTPDPK